jgi:hypothetical protein
MIADARAAFAIYRGTFHVEHMYTIQVFEFTPTAAMGRAARINRTV